VINIHHDIFIGFVEFDLVWFLKPSIRRPQDLEMCKHLD
jgi:hypothetical protein